MYRRVRCTLGKVSLMKKLSVVVVLVLTVFAGATSASAASGSTQQVAAPCCKHVI
ncbi:hypothetical protein CTE05_19350 [Cellulomonas terrae]|uniref:Uncharacterized protein n=1 Tax=Cellulomonas terrae TaxID=311234 RepID=A0A511JK46_9CELL|nr:hypothetical protein CTE05_19350 [Cellulomonas terrae]